MIRLALPLIVALCLASPVKAERWMLVAPVMIGNDQGLGIDACGVVGMIKGSDGGGDDYTVAVRSVPNSGAEVDRLTQGEVVYLCDTSEDGMWIGIVSPNAIDAECNVSGTTSGGAEPYSGPCRSGWVPKEHLSPMAG